MKTIYPGLLLQPEQGNSDFFLNGHLLCCRWPNSWCARWDKRVHLQIVYQQVLFLGYF